MSGSTFARVDLYCREWSQIAHKGAQDQETIGVGGLGHYKRVGDLGSAVDSPVFTLWSEKLTTFGDLTFFLAVRFGRMKYVRARTSHTRCAAHAKTL